MIWQDGRQEEEAKRVIDGRAANGNVPTLRERGVGQVRGGAEWKQKYVCHACGRQSRENPAHNSYVPERRDEILRAYQERSSL